MVVTFQLKITILNTYNILKNGLRSILSVKDQNNTYNNFNPSIVSISNDIRRKLPFGTFIAVLKMAGDNCNRLNATTMNSTAHHIGINSVSILQVLVENLEMMAETFIQVCFDDTKAKPLNSSSVYAGSYIKISKYNVLPNKDQNEKCGLLVGDDVRLFYSKNQLWIMLYCYGGT